MVAERLKYLRDREGMTVNELAKAVDIPRSTLNKYEHGMDPTSDVIIKLSRHFKVTTDFLLGESDNSDLGNLALSCAKMINSLKADEQDFMFTVIAGTKSKLESYRVDDPVSEKFRTARSKVDQ